MTDVLVPEVMPAGSDVAVRAARMTTLEQLRASRELEARRGRVAFTAAARTIDKTNAQAEQARIKKVSQTGSRAADAWTFFDALGEVKEGALYKERNLAKLRLFPAVQVSPNTDPVPLDAVNPDNDQPWITDETAMMVSRESYARLDGGVGTGHLTGRWGSLSFIIGDSYLVGYPDGTSPTGERFVLVAPDNLKVTDTGGWALATHPDAKPEEWTILDPQTSMIVRIWNEHAHWPELADAPLMGALDICERLLLLGHMEFGTASSHMNAGILLFPNGILGNQRQHPNDDTGNTAGNQTRNPTAQDIVDQVMTPIADPRSVAVAAPAILEAEKELIEAVRHLTLQRPFDQIAAQQLDKNITRFANVVSLPKEVILGLTDANHWTAFMIDLQTWRNYLETDARKFLGGMTRGYHQPMIRADWALLGRDETQQIGVGPDGEPLTIRNLCIGMDTSDLVGDPDEVENVFKGVETGLIGNKPARQRIGWSEAEAPTDEDVALHIAYTRGREALGPGAEALPAPAGAPADTSGAAASAPVAASAAPQGRQRRFAALGGKWANRDAALLNRLLAQSDTAMGRALDRAGAKLRTKALKASAAMYGDIVSAAPNRQVASLLGPGVVASALDVNVDELLDGSFDDLVTRFRSGVGRSQDSTLHDLESLGLEGEDVAVLEAKQREHREAAVALFAALLLSLARDRVFSPHPAAPAAGEHDIEMSVPTEIVRQAMAVAGGATGRTTPGGTFKSGPTDTLEDGIALGPDVTEALMAVGGRIAVYDWAYGDPGSRTSNFDPHLELDGLEFSSFDDDALLNPGDWPMTTHLYPGDHGGCQCQAVPRIEGVPVAEPDAGDEG